MACVRTASPLASTATAGSSRCLSVRRLHGWQRNRVGSGWYWSHGDGLSACGHLHLVASAPAPKAGGRWTTAHRRVTPPHAPAPWTVHTCPRKPSRHQRTRGAVVGSALCGCGCGVHELLLQVRSRYVVQEDGDFSAIHQGHGPQNAPHRHVTATLLPPTPHALATKPSCKQ